MWCSDGGVAATDNESSQTGDSDCGCCVAAGFEDELEHLFWQLRHCWRGCVARTSKVRTLREGLGEFVCLMPRRGLGDQVRAPVESPPRRFERRLTLAALLTHLPLTLRSPSSICHTAVAPGHAMCSIVPAHKGDVLSMARLQDLIPPCPSHQYPTKVLFWDCSSPPISLSLLTSRPLLQGAGFQSLFYQGPLDRACLLADCCY
jgi:hypothetical protein